MGIGDSIRKAADDAMKDLGNNAPPADDGHTPAPVNNDGDVQVNSSISEGSNAMDSDRSDHGTDGSDDAPRNSLAGDITKTLDPDQDLPESEA